MGKGKSERLWSSPWAKRIAVALIYAALYAAVRPFSDGIWAVSTGLRFSALLFVPYQYWPALVVGEFVPLTVVNLRCLSDFGPTWVALQSIPPMLFAMPLVWWFRERRDLFPSRKTVNLKQLLLCVTCVSVVWVLTVQLFNLTSYLQPPHNLGKLIAAALMGRYIGILTILPLALMVRNEFRSNKKRIGWREFFAHRLFLDTVLILLPILICLGLINRHGSMDTRDVTRVMMFIPVSWLTIKHGWRGAAIGTALVMGCIFLNTSDGVDLIPLQAMIAFVSTAMIALGANVSIQHDILERERINAQEATKVAQQGLYLSELRMKQVAFALEKVGAGLNLTQSRLMARFKHMMPLSETQLFYKQASTTQEEIFRLANSIHPVAWRDNGLPHVLRQTLARVLDEAGVAYECELSGRLSDLSPHVHVAVYRLVNEAIIHACEEQNCTRVKLQLRGGYTNGRHWVVMRITGLHEPDFAHINDPVFKTAGRERITQKLGAHGLSITAMRDQARLYDGEMHVKSSKNRVQLTALFHDTQKGRETSAPAHRNKQLLLR